MLATFGGISFAASCHAPHACSTHPVVQCFRFLAGIKHRRTLFPILFGLLLLFFIYNARYFAAPTLIHMLSGCFGVRLSSWRAVFTRFCICFAYFTAQTVALCSVFVQQKKKNKNAHTKESCLIRAQCISWQECQLNINVSAIHIHAHTHISAYVFQTSLMQRDYLIQARVCVCLCSIKPPVARQCRWHLVFVVASNPFKGCVCRIKQMCMCVCVCCLSFVRLYYKCIYLCRFCFVYKKFSTRIFQSHKIVRVLPPVWFLLNMRMCLHTKK